MAKHPIIQGRHLCKTYASGSEQFHAIRNVDIDIYEGDFTVIMGNSGSGKSTLLYLLSGLDGLTAGESFFKEKRIDTFTEKEMAVFRAKQIGYIYQNINLVDDLTLQENIMLPGLIAGLPKKAAAARAAALMAAMDISGQAGRLPSQTSGGQQQRAAIARALVNEPEVIFADEPTGSLNYDNSLAVLDILTEINRKGQSVVMVTHDIKAACRADRLILIRDGKIAGEYDFEAYQSESISEREQLIFSLVSDQG